MTRLELIGAVLAILLCHIALPAGAQSFDQLPPETRALLAPFAADWSQLPPERRERLLRGAERWSTLDAEERDCAIVAAAIACAVRSAAGKDCRRRDARRYANASVASRRCPLRSVTRCVNASSVSSPCRARNVNVCASAGGLCHSRVARRYANVCANGATRRVERAHAAHARSLVDQ